MASALADRLKRTTHEAGLPRNLEDRIPLLGDEPVVGVRLAPIDRYQPRRTRNRAAQPARETGDAVAAIHRLTGQLAPEPRRPAQDQNLHDPHSIRTRFGDSPL
jgi:hypothetical protein